MLIQRAPRFKSSEITDQKLYVRRREFIAGAAVLALAPLALRADEADAKTPAGAPLKATRNAAVSSGEPPTDFQSATTYNNFYEFGTDKEDPSRLPPRCARGRGRSRSTGSVAQAAERRHRRDPRPRSRSRSGCTRCAAWRRGRW